MLTVLFMMNILVRIDITEAEQIEAEALSKTRDLPIIDCLIAVQARNHGAVIVSQDKHLLNDLQDIANAIRPQDL